MNEVIRRRVGGRLIAQADCHQVGPNKCGRKVCGERDGEVRRQHRVDRFVEHHPVGDLVAVFPRQVCRILFELGHRGRRDPTAGGLWGQAEEFLDAGLGGVVDPQRQGEVVDSHHGIKSGRVHGGQLVGIVRNLILIGQRIKLRQHLGGDAVRNVHRFSRIGEDPAPFDTHPEGIGTNTVASQSGIGDVLGVRAGAVLRHPALPAEQQLVDRIVQPLPPVGVDVQRCPGAHLRLEARGGYAPVEAVGKGQCRNSSVAGEGQLDCRGRVRGRQVVR